MLAVGVERTGRFTFTYVCGCCREVDAGHLAYSIPEEKWVAPEPDVSLGDGKSFLCDALFKKAVNPEGQRARGEKHYAYVLEPPGGGQLSR
jgi:hypothetical protein